MTEMSEETTCATCGADVLKSEWHPAAVETTDAGDTIIRAFCSDQCRDQWTEASESELTGSTQPDTAAD